MDRRPSRARRISPDPAVAPPPRFESEHARTDTAVEWWFVQGFYEGTESGRRDFMATLFRTRLESADGEATTGFQLMLATLDPTTPESPHDSATWIEPEVLDAAIHRLDDAAPHVDPLLERAFTEEIRAHGPPHPIRLQPPPRLFRPAPLQVEWADFSLRQTDDGIALAFREPGSGRHVELALAAAAPRMQLDYADEALGLARGGMEYRAYPRVRITGHLDDAEELTGHAWLDHQWGDKGWLHDEETDVTRGWDWFGVNFDDGSDLVVMRHRDARSGRVAAVHATLRREGAESRTTDDVTLTPFRHWSSPATLIGYPVAWEIRLPELDAELVFEPVADAQEVPSFGTMRATWEGAGRVAGSIGGGAVRGRARGEFHGYGYVFDFDDLLRGIGRRIDRRLEEFLPRQFDRRGVERLVGRAVWKHDVAAYTERISEPTWDLLDRGGKRWRPIFGLLLLEALGVPSRPWEALVATLELIHAGALIVDDIEDESLLRRGEPCVHLRHGVDVALNAGNALYFLPGVAIMSHELLTPETRRRCLEVKERVCIEAHCGQATDIHWSRRLTPGSIQRALDAESEARILQMYAFKTAAASAGVAEIASVIAGVRPDITQGAVTFGRELGVAFQITDDIHNFSRAPSWTKVTGEDLANGKLTLVLLEALRRSRPADRARLEEILCSPELRRQTPLLEEGVDLVLGSGAIEHCRRRARIMVDDAWRRFSAHLRPSEAKIMLHTLCLKLIDLAHEG